MDYTKTLPLNGPEVDLNKVVALNHRRSITFMNNFLMNTSNFLNNFALVSEKNLFEQDAEMHKLEIAVNILEAKLSSIPGLEHITATTTNAPVEIKSSSSTADQPSNSVVPSTDLVESVTLTSEETFIKVKDDPKYAKYFKMYSVGVPKAAIAGKMQLEGLDPDLLDTPNEPAPDHSTELNDGDATDHSRNSLSDDSFSE